MSADRKAAVWIGVLHMTAGPQLPAPAPAALGPPATEPRLTAQR